MDIKMPECNYCGNPKAFIEDEDLETLEKYYYCCIFHLELHKQQGRT